MRMKSTSWIISVLAISLVGFADAQPAGDQPPANAPQPDLSVQEDQKLTPPQMLKKAGDHIARMDQGARGVRQQLTQARQERDVVKVLCLNDKLNQIDVALASANDRQKTLEALVKDNNVDGSKHEFTIITVLRNRVETLITEANQCIGEELGYLGETAVHVSIDPDIPDTDPATFPGDAFVSDFPTIVSEPRLPASPG